MKLSVGLGVFFLLGCVLAQSNVKTLQQRIQERTKFREQMWNLRQQRIENRLKNTYRWTVVLDDESKTEVRQRAFVNTENKVIIFWSADDTLEQTDGYNRTVMMQDNEGLIAVIPVRRVRRRFGGFATPYTRNGQIFLPRIKRQAPDSANNLNVQDTVTTTQRPFTRGRMARLIPFMGLGRGRGQFGGGLSRGVSIGTPGRTFGGILAQGVRGRGRGRGRGQTFNGGRGNSFGFRRGFGARRRGGGPCYIIPAKMTYADTINKIIENNATEKFDVIADILDFVTSPTSMTADMKSAFASSHPHLAQFCGEKKIYDTQTISTGSDLSIKKAFIALASWGRFKIRFKGNTA